MAPPGRPSRPRGITALSVFFGVGAAITFVSFLALLFPGGVLEPMWRLNENRFRWRNSAGDLMVESLWWQDGCPDLLPPESQDEVGEGWLVRASPAAWRALQSRYPDLEARIRIERTARDQPMHFVEE